MYVSYVQTDERNLSPVHASLVPEFTMQRYNGELSGFVKEIGCSEIEFSQALS